jgi:hypothetical protein
VVTDENGEVAAVVVDEEITDAEGDVEEIVVVEALEPVEETEPEVTDEVAEGGA